MFLSSTQDGGELSARCPCYFTVRAPYCEHVLKIQTWQPSELRVHIFQILVSILPIKFEIMDRYMSLNYIICFLKRNVTTLAHSTISYSTETTRLDVVNTSVYR
jgi:hypothetical protein